MFSDIKACRTSSKIHAVMLKHAEDENENPNDGDVSDGVLDPNCCI